MKKNRDIFDSFGPDKDEAQQMLRRLLNAKTARRVGVRPFVITAAGLAAALIFSLPLYHLWRQNNEGGGLEAGFPSGTVAGETITPNDSPDVADNPAVYPAETWAVPSATPKVVVPATPSPTFSDAVPGSEPAAPLQEKRAPPADIEEIRVNVNFMDVRVLRTDEAELLVRQNDAAWEITKAFTMNTNGAAVDIVNQFDEEGSALDAYGRREMEIHLPKSYQGSLTIENAFGNVSITEAVERLDNLSVRLSFGNLIMGDLHLDGDLRLRCSFGELSLGDISTAGESAITADFGSVSAGMLDAANFILDGEFTNYNILGHSRSGHDLGAYIIESFDESKYSPSITQLDPREITRLLFGVVEHIDGDILYLRAEGFMTYYQRGRLESYAVDISRIEHRPKAGDYVWIAAKTLALGEPLQATELTECPQTDIDTVFAKFHDFNMSINVYGEVEKIENGIITLRDEGLFPMVYGTKHSHFIEADIRGAKVLEGGKEPEAGDYIIITVDSVSAELPLKAIGYYCNTKDIYGG